jgi:hypothetical protein
MENQAPNSPPLKNSSMRWYNTRLEIRLDRAKDGHAPVRLVITINKERLSLGFDKNDHT